MRLSKVSNIFQTIEKIIKMSLSCAQLCSPSVFLTCVFWRSRAARAEGASEGGGAAEQNHQMFAGRRLRLLLQPFVQTFGKTARTPHSVHPRPAEDFLFEAGGFGAAACNNRQVIPGHVAVLETREYTQGDVCSFYTSLDFIPTV